MAQSYKTKLAVHLFGWICTIFLNLVIRLIPFRAAQTQQAYILIPYLKISTAGPCNLAEVCKVLDICEIIMVTAKMTMMVMMMMMMMMTIIIIIIIIKVTIPLLTGREAPWVCETSRLLQFLDNRLTDSGEVISSTRRPPFTPRKIPGTYFC
jgi:hypothetical protein